MKKPFRIQLAIQGGGAKICTLLAAMEAVQSLEDEKLLKVTRIAGTSAGAIVGSLFAAGIRMTSIKVLLEGGLGADLVVAFSPPSVGKVLWNVARDKPFWDSTLLEGPLKKLFEKNNLLTFDDLFKKSGIEVMVVAADLGKSEKVIHKDKENIVESIMNSCGLPYCFRVWDKSPVMVDGGICENLPIAELEKHEATDGPIIAISFDKPRSSPPRTMKEFSLALLDAAMNNSINRAKSALSRNSIFSIDVGIGTFDFQEALDRGLKDTYRHVRKEADRFFRDFVEERSTGWKAVVGDPWSDPNSTAAKVMASLWEVYEHQHAGSTFKYLECTLEVQANCLLQENEPNHGSPDLVRYFLTFQPAEEPIYCLSAALGEPPDGTYTGRTIWEVRDADKNLIKSIGVPARNLKSPKDRELLQFFHPFLRPNSGTYTLLYKDELLGAMEPLVKVKKDELSFWPRRASGSVKRINLVLHVPNGRSVRMVAKERGPQGRAMTGAELAEYEVPYGFFTLGWTGENLEISDKFGADLFDESV